MRNSFKCAFRVLAVVMLCVSGAHAADGTWTQLESAPLSVTLAQHAAVYDPLRHRMVVIGGDSAGVFLNDVWSFDLQGVSGWTRLEPTGVPPADRYEISAIYDPVRDRIMIFGGFSNVANYEVWTLSMSGTPAWAKLAPPGLPPPPRAWHSAIYDPIRDRMIIYGGANNLSCWPETLVFGDVWALSLSETPAWTQIRPGGPLPPARCDHAAIYDPVRDQMLIGGGLSGGFCWGPFGTIYYDLWALSLSGTPEWSQVPVAGYLASAMYRYGHSFVYDDLRDRILVFAGTDLNWGHGLMHDVWEITLPDSTTRPLSPLGELPPWRINHAAIYDRSGDRMVIFGGQPFGAYGSRDLWALSFDMVTPITAGVVRAEATPGSVTLEWSVGGHGSDPISVERARGVGSWVVVAKTNPNGEGRVCYLDREVVPGQRYGYRLTWLESGRGVVAGETWVSVPAMRPLNLQSVEPNPARGLWKVRFTLPIQSAAELEVYDLAGRLLYSRDVGDLGAGEHVVELGADVQLAPGAYLIRLTQGGTARTLHAVMIR